ncbi:MAG: glycosyltransferase family 2 protein [Candidatus Zixiibacteriota bacterium]|nr:MAG: glycosyltransferase family 2 protein [candidate division Zixibacteria bacterium]
MNKIAVIIPTYNAGTTIAELIESISRFVSREDIVVIDDGSCDRTFETARTTGAMILKHDANRGKGEALKTGFRYARRRNCPAVITLDADLQHDPESIPDFVRKANGFSGIIIGTRKRSLRIMPFGRWLTNNLTSAIVSVLSGQSIRDSQSGYRLITAQVLKSVKLDSKKYDLESEILIKAKRKGFDITEVPIRTIYAGGRSFINPLVDTARFIRLMWRSLWW